MQVLIMGGTRFLGKFIVETLVRHGYGVTSVNIDENASSRLPPGVESIFCNRKDHAKLRGALDGRPFDAVLDIGNAPTLPEDIAVVLDSVGPALKRYVFCSTSTVYKKPIVIFPTTEDHPVDGGSRPYTQNKLKCEEFLFVRFRRDGTPITIIRPRHIYGPESYEYREGFFFDRLTRDRPVFIPGEGSLITQFGYVEDMAESFRLALERDEAVGQAYTITGKECITFNAYVDLLGKVTGRKVKKIFFDPKLLEKFDKPGLSLGESLHSLKTNSHICYDVSKAKEQLGYVPRFSLEEGLRKAFAWYLQTGGNTYVKRVMNFELEDEFLRLVSAADGSTGRP